MNLKMISKNPDTFAAGIVTVLVVIGAFSLLGIDDIIEGQDVLGPTGSVIYGVIIITLGIWLWFDLKNEKV